MPDQTTARVTHPAAEARKPFVSPEVKDLGGLQTLTQLLQGTIILEP